MSGVVCRRSDARWPPRGEEEDPLWVSLGYRGAGVVRRRRCIQWAVWGDNYFIAPPTVILSKVDTAAFGTVTGVEGFRSDLALSVPSTGRRTQTGVGLTVHRLTLCTGLDSFHDNGFSPQEWPVLHFSSLPYREKGVGSRADPNLLFLTTR